MNKFSCWYQTYGYVSENKIGILGYSKDKHKAKLIKGWYSTLVKKIKVIELEGKFYKLTEIKEDLSVV
jgi:hypothetical protein